MALKCEHPCSVDAELTTVLTFNANVSGGSRFFELPFIRPLERGSWIITPGTIFELVHFRMQVLVCF